MLLLEAGATNTAPELCYLAERYMTFMNPSVNYGYQLTPQKHLLGRTIDQSRGKALGGSSAINFAHWTVGPRDDFDRWAELVGDSTFGWQRMREQLERLENVKTPTTSSFENGKWVKLRDEDHGHDGLLPVEYPEKLERGFMDYMTAAEQVISPLKWMVLQSWTTPRRSIAPQSSSSAVRLSLDSVVISEPCNFHHRWYG